MPSYLNNADKRCSVGLCKIYFSGSKGNIKGEDFPQQNKEINNRNIKETLKGNCAALFTLRQDLDKMCPSHTKRRHQIESDDI